MIQIVPNYHHGQRRSGVAPDGFVQGPAHLDEVGTGQEAFARLLEKFLDRRIEATSGGQFGFNQMRTRSSSVCLANASIA